MIEGGTADPRTVLRDRIAEVAQREYCNSITTAGTVAHAEYLGMRIAAEVMELFPDVWEQHTIDGVCYVARTP